MAKGIPVTDDTAQQLEQMSEVLEKEVTAVVRDVLKKYYHPSRLDELVKPVAGWACGLPFEAYEKGYPLLMAKP
jgi:hypothetical protein